jgi:hypothetical protein
VVVLFITRKQHGGYGAAFFTSGNQCLGMYSISTPGLKSSQVIAKNFNPVNRAEFNPRVESAPCNQPLMPLTMLSKLV